MEPPLQMPFGYPTRVLYECKAYEGLTSLSIVRNALGLRLDINEFEIVTKSSLSKRKNNSRSEYAIEQRDRYIYQVGIASIYGFTKPAVEFAANNKIPLLSLQWILDDSHLGMLKQLNQEYIDQLDRNYLNNLFSFLTNSTPNQYYRDNFRYLFDAVYVEWVSNFLCTFEDNLKSLYVGLLESGDMIFLKAKDNNYHAYMSNTVHTSVLKARIHYQINSLGKWELDIIRDNETISLAKFDFFVPDTIMKRWKESNFSRLEATAIKQSYFARIFIYNHSENTNSPVTIVNVDSNWLANLIRTEQRW
ncbi:hypothetical protein [Dehalococcoides mccartyi]|nr:hypothetical protein [Dehalococcoides mccartyi]MBF4482101.1 hypothetical protein [Dehalococcoides mccartyi]